MDVDNTTGDRARYHHGDLAAALVRAAREVLATPGAELSLREAARRAGVSHAAPYRHFDGLPALLDAVAAAVLADLATRLEAAARTAGPAAAALRALADEYLRTVLDRPGEAALAFGRPKEAHAPGSAVAVAAERAFAAVAAVVERGCRSGEFRDVDTHEAAVAGWALIHGTATLVASGQLPAAEPAARAALLDRSLAVLLGGLLASSGGKAMAGGGPTAAPPP